METKSTGQIIKEILGQKGISQKELSASAGVTEAAMSHYIKGDRVPRGANLLNIAKALGTTTNVLLGETETDDISYEERPVRILDVREKVLRGKTIRLVRVLWQHHGAESTWEREDEVRAKYPDLFDS